MPKETITLGGGCFWCIDSAYRMMKGVVSVRSGYAGGELKSPSYKDICTGQTGHAEVVEVVFDSSEIDLQAILKAFFSLHDPTTLNRQGADVGTQYRSVIFYHSESQQTIATKMIEQLTEAAIWPDPIVTELSEVPEFYEAEDYHQNYYVENPNERYCQWVISPKLKKFKMECDVLIQ